MLRTVLLVLIASLLVTPTVGLIEPTAAANNSTATTTTMTLPDDETTVTTTLQLTKTLTLVKWEFSNNTFRITFKAAIPTSIHLSDTGMVSKALSEDGGADTVRVNGRSIALASGKTTVAFRATVHDGESAVSIGTTGDGAILRTGAIGHGDRPPVEWESVQLLVLGTASVVGFAAVVFVKRRREDETMEAERLE